MNRRLVVLVGLTLALLGDGVQRALAQSPAPVPAPVPAPSLPPAPPVMPPPIEPVPLPTAALPPPAAMPHLSGSAAIAPGRGVSNAPGNLPAERPQTPSLGSRPALEGGLLDPALAPVGAEPPVQVGTEAGAGAVDPFVLPPAKLPLGRQSVGLTVDVVGPAVLNLNQITTFQIVVRNSGTTDALGVVVRDELPESLNFVSSQPEAERNGALLFWKLKVVPAGSETKILVRAKAIKVGEFDHAATVTMRAGSKSRTIVREPKLKVEQSTTSSKVLKGQQVQFKITISNPGDGPARNVVVQAKLSPGLRHESGEPNDQNLFEQTLPQIEPGQRVVLDALVADTRLAGDQTCTVVAQCTDVTTSRDDAKSIATVTVIEPKLKVSISGDEKRLTDMIATYNITVENPGTATSHNVYVLASVPLSGRLITPPPTGARWDASSGKLVWRIPQVEPGEKLPLSFQFRMGGVGNYTVTVDARADVGLSDHASCRTDVQGLADFEFEVREQRRVVDVGDVSAFDIRIKNIGTKEATNILVSAEYSKSLEPKATRGNDGREAQFNADLHKIVFPMIERLAPSQEVVMGIQVKANLKGMGICRVFLLHDDLAKDEELEDMASFKITARRN